MSSHAPVRPAASHAGGHVLEVVVPAGDRVIEATLARPAEAVGLVILPGCGVGRSDPRLRAMAAIMQRAGLATLLFDLLDVAEAQRRSTAFDVREHATRLLEVVRWTVGEPLVRTLPVGIVASGTAAATALDAAAREPAIRAVVGCGARTDLAADDEAAVTTPVLLLVGERDPDVLALNRRALGELAGVRRLVVMPGATHRLSEPHAAEEVSRQATAWMLAFLPPKPQVAIRPAPGGLATMVAPQGPHRTDRPASGPPVLAGAPAPASAVRRA